MTREEEAIAQEMFDLRHAYWNSQEWDYTEWDELEYDIRKRLKIPFGKSLDWSPN